MWKLFDLRYLQNGEGRESEREREKEKRKMEKLN